MPWGRRRSIDGGIVGVKEASVVTDEGAARIVKAELGHSAELRR